MVGTASNAGLRRKARIARDEQEARAMSPGRALRLAMEKTANEVFSLVLSVQGLARSETDHAGLMTQIPDGLLLLLDGPDGAVGVMTLDHATLSALIEMQTVGQVLNRPPRDRPLTRTDAALAAPLVDGVLHRMTQDLADHPDRHWACGYRFGAMIDDRRSLGLAMGAPDYHLFRLDLDIAGGARHGQAILVLPWRRDPEEGQRDDAREVASRNLHARVLDAPVRLDAVLCRLSLPLSAIGKLAVGDVLPLPTDALRDIAVEGVGRRRVAMGCLGKIDGLRAIRLNLPGPQPLIQAAAAAQTAQNDARSLWSADATDGFEPMLPGTSPGQGNASSLPPADVTFPPPGSLPYDPLDAGSLGGGPLDDMRITDDLDDLARFGFPPGPEAA